MLDGRDVDVVFSDISMPGLDGMALARVISRFTVRPQIVFVTAHDEHAVDAFALAATDYVMKPVRAERLSEAIRRVVVAQSERGTGDAGRRPASRLARPSRTRRSRSSSAASPGSSTAARSATPRRTATTRACTPTPARTSCACRSACSRSGGATIGFVRIHRSTLVALPHVSEVRMDHGRCSVVVGAVELQVSRRHTKELRDTLLRRPIGDRRPNGG